MPRLIETQTRTGTMVFAINRILVTRGADDDTLLLTRAWLAWVRALAQ